MVPSPVPGAIVLRFQIEIIISVELSFVLGDCAAAEVRLIDRHIVEDGAVV